MGSSRWQRVGAALAPPDPGAASSPCIGFECLITGVISDGGAILHPRFYFPACNFLKVRYKKTIFVVFELIKQIESKTNRQCLQRQNSNQED
jgi:hypothetical protein